MWTKEELMMLATMVGKNNFYGNNQKGEFFVNRQNGHEEIFKSYAVNVIPGLDANNLEELYVIWPKILKLAQKSDFNKALNELAESADEKDSRAAETVYQTMVTWKEKCVKWPHRLEESLQRILLNTTIVDRQLSLLFKMDALSEDVPTQVNQLVNRMVLAFGLMNPFYCLEAIVGDQSFLLNGKKEEISIYAGRIDALEFLLPIAFSEQVKAKAGNWNGLDWQTIYDLAKQAMGDKLKKRILLGIARILGKSVENIIFAANAIKWLSPVNGSTKELSEIQALMKLDELISLSEPLHKTASDVLAETNAYIRAMNYFPLVQSEENFSGRLWRYASVCDTVNSLFKVLKDNPQIWKGSFGKIFNKEYVPQLEKLDASSAKGRFFYQLIIEKMIKSDIFRGINQSWQKDTINRLFYATRADQVNSPFHRILPSYYIGGKASGFGLVSMAIGKENVLDGFVISPSMVENLLSSNRELWNMIISLDGAAVFKDKLGKAKSICAAIKCLSIPSWLERFIADRLNKMNTKGLLAIRSASNKEHIARGIYESFLSVAPENCIKMMLECIASFFSTEAVSFRFKKRSRDLPHFGVIVMPYVEAEGGTATMKLKEDRLWLEATLGKSAENVTAAAESAHKQWQGFIGEGMNETFARVSVAISNLFMVYGPVEIEFAVLPDKQIVVLQLELLPMYLLEPKKKPTVNGLEKKRIDTIEEFVALAKLLADSKKYLLDLGPCVDLNTLASKLFLADATIRDHRNGGKISDYIQAIRANRPIPHTCHFSNNCRSLGIWLAEK